MTLSFQDARTLADGARTRALEPGKALSIAVVDYGGFGVLIERMDGARPTTRTSPCRKRIRRQSCSENQQICEDIVRSAGFELDFPAWAGARRH